MKKFAFCLMACLACFQFSNALEKVDLEEFNLEEVELEDLEKQLFIRQVGATSAFTESANEMSTILREIANGNFPAVKPNEFAVTLFRETQNVDTTGKVNYILETCVVNNKHKCKKINRYQVIIRVTPNPGIGPRLIEVLSVTKVKRNQNFVERMLNHEDEGEILN